MSCYYIDQTLTPHAYFGEGVWQDDCTLEQPRLKGPENSAKLCYQNGVWVEGGTGISVEWYPVPGASFYVLQTSINSSFFGPDFKSYKISGHTPYYNFLEGDIRFGETVYWRVWAYSNSGCTSIKSEERSFTWDCEVQDGKNGNPGGSGSTNPDINYCEAYKIQLDIEGPDRMYCCDQEDWFAKIAYSCKDALGNEQVALVNTEWVVTKDAGGAGKITELPFFDRLILVSSCHVSQKLIITYKATFREISTLRVFTCQATKGVTINCETNPKDKPWLKASSYADDLHLIAPFYKDDPVGGINHFTASWLFDDSFLLDPVGAGNGKTVSIAGPVFEVEERRVVSPNLANHQSSDCCAPRFQSDYVYESVLEARASFSLGCGLIRRNDRLTVALDEIAGDGLIADLDNCKLHTEEAGGAYLGFVLQGDSESKEYIDNGEWGIIELAVATGTDIPYGYDASASTLVVSNPLKIRVWKDSLVLVKQQKTTHELSTEEEPVSVADWIIIAAYSAKFLSATLTEDMLPSTTTVSVDTLQTVDGHYTVAGSLTVHNVYDKFGALYNKVLLMWNDTESRWEIVTVEGSSFIWYRGFLAEQVTLPTGTATVTPQVSLNSGIEIATATGGDVEAINYIGGVGDIGDYVICAWNAASNEHYLMKVEAKLFQPLVDLEIDLVNNVVKGHRKKVYVMTWTQEEDNYITVEDTEECPV